MAAGFSVNVATNAHSVALELMAEAREMQTVAMMRAINRMAEQVKVQAAREVRAAGYGIKVSDIKAAIRIQRATQSSLTARVVASGRPIPLVKYGARQTARGVSVKVQKGRKVIPHVFLATMPNGKVGVFEREAGGKHRKVNKGGKVQWHQLPIRELYGPSIPDGMANSAVSQALQAMIAQRFPTLLEHEQKWLANGGRRGRR